jgi:hypothetical protein
MNSCRVYTGQAFEHPLVSLPSFVTWIAQTIMSSFNRLVSTATIVEMKAGAQCFMYPLILGAQAVHVANANEAPSMHAEEEQEDISLLVPSLTPSPNSKDLDKARLQYFSKEDRRKVR